MPHLISRKCYVFFLVKRWQEKSAKLKSENWWGRRRQILNGWWWKNQSWIFHLKLPRNFFHQISADLIYLKKMPDFFFCSNDEKQSQTLKNWWRRISDGWWWKNQSWIFHLKLPHNFFHQISVDSWHWRAISISRKCSFFFLSNDDKQSQSLKNWWRQISDGWWWKNQSWIFHLKLPRNFFHQISSDGWRRRALNISRKWQIFFFS